MSSRNSISQNRLDDVCRSLKDKSFRTQEDKDWVKMFNDIPLVVRREMVRLLEKEQTLSIIKGMHFMYDNIEVPFLGKFNIKSGRKDYINLRRENPDLPIEDIVEMVKENFKNRPVKKRSKGIVNLKPIKNEDRTIT